jgi:hypothetical protein
LVDEGRKREFKNVKNERATMNNIIKTTFAIAAISCLSFTAVHARGAAGGGGMRSAGHISSSSGATGHHLGSMHQNSTGSGRFSKASTKTLRNRSSRLSSARNNVNHRVTKATGRTRDRLPKASHRLSNRSVSGSASANANVNGTRHGVSGNTNARTNSGNMNGNENEKAELPRNENENEIENERENDNNNLMGTVTSTEDGDGGD